MLDEWEAALGKNKYKTKPEDVLDAMLTDLNGGDWFKRNFMILMESCIFECSADRYYIGPNITENLYDTSKINRYNWCSHLMMELFHRHDNWMQNKTDSFCGPIFFPGGKYKEIDLEHFNRIAKSL